MVLNMVRYPYKNDFPIGDDSDCSLKGNYKCARCAGTGGFVTCFVNGAPSGPGGICSRCGGKGFTTDKDRRRNWEYDRFGRRAY